MLCTNRPAAVGGIYASIPTFNVSHCILTNSSFNLTAEDEVAVFYIQHKHPLNSYESEMTTLLPNAIHVLKHTLLSTHSQHGERSLEAEHSSDSNSQPETNWRIPTAGVCTLLIKGPPGKVLSILVQNQTCSRDNQVRVEDIHDGWSTTLNGCLPWQSPGYDVTTVNSSAVMVIHLHNIYEFYQLKVHVAALVAPTTRYFIRYISPTFGYIQTQGWHPFTRSFSGIIGGTAAILIPMNQSVLVSVVYVNLLAYKYEKDPEVKLEKRPTSRSSEERVWCVSLSERISPSKRPYPVLIEDSSEFSVEFKNVHGLFFSGIRLLFSFHAPPSAPQQYNDSSWNCSVSSWPDFQQHFLCNYRTECSDEEDERWCQHTTCHGHVDDDKVDHKTISGSFQIGDSCYFFRFLSASSWPHADMACRTMGAELASFTTVNSWYHLALLTQNRGYNDISFFGVRSPDASLKHMYRYALQWENGLLAHYYYHLIMVDPPYCGLSTHLQDIQMINCGQVYADSYALCQVAEKTMNNVELSSDITIQHSDSLLKHSKILHPDIWEKLPVSSIQCPDQHRTQEFLAYDAYSVCWFNYDVRTDEANVTADYPAMAAACSAGVGMMIHFKTIFTCESGKTHVPYSLVCNHLQDCMDNSDEDFCVFPSCSASSQYQCANGQCIQFRQWCDGLVQCLDESDEADCAAVKLAKIYGQWIFLKRPPQLADFDGRGFIVYTKLTSTGSEDNAAVCPDTHLFCPGEGFCVPVYVRCNGVYDCPGREDEIGCDSYTCPGLYRCRGLLGICLHPDSLCDGWPQCLQHDDEVFCNLTCPVNCTCLGHAFDCSRDFQVELFHRLRYLDASNTRLEPVRLENNVMLVYLRLSSCSLAHMGNLSLPNLRSLDLSDNKFIAITVAELNELKNLRNLSLARNPLSGLFSGNMSSMSTVLLSHKQIMHLDLTGAEIDTLDVRHDLPFPNLLSLNLSYSGVGRLAGDGFQSMTSLVVLDLRGCPISVLPRGTFSGLQDLHRLFSDSFKLCCPANLPEGFNVGNCQAPFNEVSSCDALLRSDIYRVCLSVLATLAVSGNLGCFCLRVFANAGRGKTGFNVFVTHLCVSDFMMGVYLVIIGVTDRLYLGRYLWEDDRWQHSVTCQVAGVLGLLSSEVSAFIICLITLDRFLVIRFPFSGLVFSSFLAHVASATAWIGGSVLVAVPLLPATSHWRFYGQTGICVPLPITKNKFAGHRYAFGVMILLNLLVFLMIAVGQISVYMSMTRNAMSSMDTIRKSRDLIVARRLLTVVVSDFLCWFPLGLLGVLAAQGVPIPGEVNVGMAIFVLPLNSALNPFLYTLNMIQEKRRRATEEKLVKVIMDLGINDDQCEDKE